MLPGLKSYATCIRFSQYLYKLTKPAESNDLMLKLPYQMIFAVGTVDQILVYTT
jgi:hypothetical protein